MTAFRAPADAPEMPSIASRPSVSKLVEHAPGEGPMGSAALEREIDALAAATVPAAPAGAGPGRLGHSVDTALFKSRGNITSTW